MNFKYEAFESSQLHVFYFDTFSHLSQLNGDVKCTTQSAGVLSSRYTQNKRRRITKIKQNTDTFTEYTNSHLSLADDRVILRGFLQIVGSSVRHHS